MRPSKLPELYYLWHPGTEDTVSGYGLMLAPGRLVGALFKLVLLDHKDWAIAVWRAFKKPRFFEIDKGGHGVLCQMVIAEESMQYVKPSQHPWTVPLRRELKPLLKRPPIVTLCLAWNEARQCWISTILKHDEINASCLP